MRLMTLISNDLTSPMIERFLTSYNGVLYSYHALLPLARLGDGCSLPCTLALNNALSWWKATTCATITYRVYLLSHEGMMSHIIQIQNLSSLISVIKFLKLIMCWQDIRKNGQHNLILNWSELPMCHL
jgi:hypothetical protein